MLTELKLRGMQHKDIFARGEFPQGLVEFPSSGLRWVAVRGGGPVDWAIYIGTKEETDDHICDLGDKLFVEKSVRTLVPCDDAAWLAYRL